MSGEATEQRNARIVDAARAGASVPAIASAERLSETCVRNIINKGGGNGRVATTVTVRALIDTAARCTRFSVDQIIGKSRARPIVHVRHIVMHLATVAGHSSPVIGAALGGRDHTTVIHGLSAIRARMERDATLSALANRIMAECPKRGEVVIAAETVVMAPVVIVRGPSPVEQRASALREARRNTWVDVEYYGDKTIALNGDGDCRHGVAYRDMLASGSARLAEAINQARAA